MLDGPRATRRCLAGGIAGDIGAGQRRDDERLAQEPIRPISESTTEVAATLVAASSAGASRRPSAAGAVDRRCPPPPRPFLS